MIGDAVNDQGVFTPTILGLNVLKYAVDVSGCRDTAELITTVYERPFLNWVQIQQFAKGILLKIC